MKNVEDRAHPRPGNRPALATQYYTALAATMGGLAMGVIVGYSSPAGPLLLGSTSDGYPAGPLLGNITDRPHTTTSSDVQPQNRTTTETLQLSQEEYNWFSSSVNIGGAAGGLVGGVMISTLGRRATMMLSVLPYLAGWALIAGGQNVLMLVAGRVITGVCMGVTCTAVPTYIGEFASADIRGTLGSGFQVMVTLGILLVYVVGAALCSWRWLAVVCTIPTLIYILMLAFTKESPSFLLSQGRDEEAKASLQYFRGGHYNVQEELSMIKGAVAEAKLKKASLREMAKPHNLKPLVICLAILFFAQSSGITPLLFNMAIVFKDSGSSVTENASVAIIAGVQVLATVVGALLMDQAGRRLLLAVSSALMSLCMVSLGGYCYMKEIDAVWTVEALGWLPLVALVVFIAAYSVGFGPTVWVLMGELFSPEVKDASASLAMMVNWTASFIVTLTFLPLQTALGDYSAYWLFGGMCLAALVFTILLVPETKGKTLQEITAHFGGPAAQDSHCQQPRESLPLV
ncbi:facilitated trehalose transporter Tret1 [Procambarus clarkii]|uniref:facilitated trehalose transporter Tret1 n=1 Tax=Procambarus clarkii TaxID=6728 RepID=UPI003743A238